METELPDWHQPFTEGLTRGPSSSTDVCTADVAVPPSAIPPSAHPPAKPTSNKSGGKHNFYTHFPRDPYCEVHSHRTLMQSEYTATVSRELFSCAVTGRFVYAATVFPLCRINFQRLTVFPLCVICPGRGRHLNGCASFPKTVSALHDVEEHLEPLH